MIWAGILCAAAWLAAARGYATVERSDAELDGAGALLFVMALEFVGVLVAVLLSFLLRS